MKTDNTGKKSIKQKSKHSMDAIETEYSFIEVKSENLLFCTVCSSAIKYNKKQGNSHILKHLATKKHISCINNSDDRNLTTTSNDPSLEILKWMLINNIPLSRLDNIEFASFIKNISNIKIYSASQYRKKHFTSIL